MVCGNERLLKATEKKGIQATGITVSEKEVKFCFLKKKKSLNVFLIDYKDIPKDWFKTFDAIVANGSIEHFVQLKDVLDKKQDMIYKNFFDICSNLLKDKDFMVNIIIHFNKMFKPAEISKGSKCFKKDSDNFHFARLVENFGGWYPKDNQLEKCAREYFKQITREDGTENYHITSEYWIKLIKKRIKTKPEVWFSVIKKFLKHLIIMSNIIDIMLFSQS